MNNTADKLYNLLGTKFNNTDIKTLDSTGKETTDMEEIEMFSFDFLVNSKNYGPVVILLSANENLEVYYGDNTSKSLDPDAKKKWENLIEHLSTFARSNRLGFSLKHTTDLKYDLSNITDITESYKNIFEGYYGTKKTSYSPQGKAKIIIKHSKAIGEDDKRFRNISQIFIENADGERFKLPFKKLAGARAMARHVTEGGNPYDLFGLHISEMVNDINTLGGFVRRSKMYEGNDDAMSMVETGRSHCKELRKGLNRIAGVRGYKTYKESWEPSAITEQDTDTDKIRGMFTQTSVNQRTEDALPLLARLQQMAEAQGEMPAAEKIGHEEDDLPYNWDEHEEPPTRVVQTSTGPKWVPIEEDTLTELTDPMYKGFKITFSKVPGKKLAARATSRAGVLIAGAYGKNEAKATEAVQAKIDDYMRGLKRVTGKANINVNASFAQNHLKAGESVLWARLDPGPKLVVAGEQSFKNEKILPGYLKGEHFTKTGNRKKASSETGTDLLGFGINPQTAAASQAIANSRYTVSDPTRDADGNLVYDLEFDSIVTSTNEKLVLPMPALTVATARGLGENNMENNIDEAYGETYPTQSTGSFSIDALSGSDNARIIEFLNKIGVRHKEGAGTSITIMLDRRSLKASTVLSHLHNVAQFDELDESIGAPQRTNDGRGDGQPEWQRHPDEDDWGREDELDDEENDPHPYNTPDEPHSFHNHTMEDTGEPTEEETYRKIRDFSVTALKGYARRLNMDAEIYQARGMDEDDLIDEIMGYLYDDMWEINLLKQGMLRPEMSEMKEINEFEEWATGIVEGVMNLPETPDQLDMLRDYMSKEQPVGIDAINATDVLHELIGDDDLLDQLSATAADDPEADGRPVVVAWLRDAIQNKEFKNPNVLQNIKMAVQNSRNDMQQEGLNAELDADHETQLNASANKDIDKYIKKDVNENANERKQIDKLAAQMKQATADNDEAAYRRADAKMNALSNKMQARNSKDDKEDVNEAGHKGNYNYEEKPEEDENDVDAKEYDDMKSGASKDDKEDLEENGLGDLMKRTKYLLKK